MDKVTKAEIHAEVVEVLGKLGIAKNDSSLLAEIEKSDLSSVAKRELTTMLTKAETLDRIARRNSMTSPATGPASSEIDALAKEFVQKSNKPMDLATARVEIRKLHPDLARKEQDEYRRF